MKASGLTFALVVFLASAAGASAQTAVSTAIAMTPEQRTLIKAHVLKERRSSATAPTGFTPKVGATLPRGIEFYWMPPETGLNRYRYVVIGDQAFVVDWEDRRIIEAVK